MALQCERDEVVHFMSRGSAPLPLASHQRVPLLAPWHNWQTVWCHLTLLFSVQPFPLLPSPNGKGGEWGSLSHVSLLCRNSPLTVWLQKQLHTELHISGSGSANVGDRGIWGLKPLYLPLLKSCFMAYTSALANIICIVCLQASYIWSMWMSSLDLCRGSFAFVLIGH